MRNKGVRALVAVLILAAGGLGYYLYTLRTARTAELLLSGNIEVTEAQLGFKIAGRLAERLVDEGERVTKGQLLARLDNTDQVLGVTQAIANVAYAKAVLADKESGSRSQEIAESRATVAQSQAMVESAQAQYDNARADYLRFAALHKQKVVSTHENDSYRTAHETALKHLDEAKAILRAQEEQLSLRVEGTRKDQIEQARAQLDVAQETLKQAQVKLEYTELHAPFPGVVLSKAAEPGEYLNVGSPVLTVGELDRVWLRAYVPETMVGRVQLGQSAGVTTDSLPDKVFPGRVSFISSEAEFTPKTVQTPQERVKLVYRIKIDLDNPDHRLKPGLPADARLADTDVPQTNSP